jgi:hypothetical protein
MYRRLYLLLALIHGSVLFVLTGCMLYDANLMGHDELTTGTLRSTGVPVEVQAAWYWDHSLVAEILPCLLGLLCVVAFSCLARVKERSRVFLVLYLSAAGAFCTTEIGADLVLADARPFLVDVSINRAVGVDYSGLGIADFVWPLVLTLPAWLFLACEGIRVLRDWRQYRRLRADVVAQS